MSHGPYQKNVNSDFVTEIFRRIFGSTANDEIGPNQESRKLWCGDLDLEKMKRITVTKELCICMKLFLSVLRIKH